MIDRSLFSIHFEQLKEINSHTLDFDASLTFGELCYLAENPKNKRKLIKKGLQVIPKSKARLAQSLGWSLGKLNDILDKLKNYKLIQIIIGKWYNIKSSFFYVKEGIRFKPNMRKIKFLNKYTGGYKETVMYLRFLYESNIGALSTRGQDWVRVAFSEFKSLLTSSLTTCNQIKKQLVDRGLVQCEGSYGGGEHQYYARINKLKYDQILSEWIEEDRKYRAEIKRRNEAKKQTQKTDSVVSYNNRDLNTRSIINNNIEDIEKREEKTDDIIVFANSVHKMDERDWRYARAALERTILKTTTRIDNVKRLWGEVRFALLTPQHTQRMQSFKHAINSFMQMIRNGTWKMPFGYDKYSDECRNSYNELQQHYKSHYEQKSPRELRILQQAGHLPLHLQINVPRGLKSSRKFESRAYYFDHHTQEWVAQEWG